MWVKAMVFLHLYQIVLINGDVTSGCMSSIPNSGITSVIVTTKENEWKILVWLFFHIFDMKEERVRPSGSSLKGTIDVYISHDARGIPSFIFCFFFLTDLVGMHMKFSDSGNAINRAQPISYDWYDSSVWKRIRFLIFHSSVISLLRFLFSRHYILFWMT